MKIGDILGNVNAISNRHETQSVYNYWHLYSETLIADKYTPNSLQISRYLFTNTTDRLRNTTVLPYKCKLPKRTHYI